MGRHLDILHVARHRLNHDLVLQQVRADLLRVGRGLVDLVDRHDHRDAGGLRVVDGLDRLRHHRVIGGHHQHNDVGHVRTARTHRGEGGVTGRVQEGQHRTRVGRHLIGADVLGDAAGLARHDVRLTDTVQKRGLAVVHVAHDRDDRRARLQVLGLVLDGMDDLFHVGVRHADGAVAEFLDHQFGGVGVDGLVGRDHHAHLHQRLDDIGRAFRHAVRQLADDDGFGQLHVAHLLFGTLHLAHRLGARLFLLALHRSKAALAPALAPGQGLGQRQAARAAAFLGLRLGLGIAVAAGVATVAVRAARACGHARLLGTRGSGLGRGAVRGSGTLGGLRRDLGLLLGAQLGFAQLAGVLFGLQPQGFLALALLAFLCLDFGAATLALFLAGLFLGGAARVVLGLARLGGGKGLEAAFHFRFGDPGRALGRIRGHGRRRIRPQRRVRARHRLGRHDALALGLDHHVMRAPVAEALLHLAGPPARAAAQTQGLLSVSIVHPLSNPSRQPNCRYARADRSVCWRP